MDIVCYLHAPSIGANRSAPQWSLLVPTRKSPYVRLRSAIRHITDMILYYAGRSPSSYPTNTHAAKFAPRFALQAAPFQVCRLRHVRRAEQPHVHV